MFLSLTLEIFVSIYKVPSQSFLQAEQAQLPQPFLTEEMLQSPYHPHSFSKDLFHVLPRHRGEADRSVVPRILLSTVFKMGTVFPSLQSSGTSPHCHDLSNMLENGLATASANSLRIWDASWQVL